MYSGITSGRVLNGELLYTKILEVNLFAFAGKCKQINFYNLCAYIHIYIHQIKSMSSTLGGVQTHDL